MVSNVTWNLEGSRGKVSYLVFSDGDKFEKDWGKRPCMMFLEGDPPISPKVNLFPIMDNLL